MPTPVNAPLVSVIIPTRNRCKLLVETLESVRNQTYQNWEAVVVDDHSDDCTWSVLSELSAADARIRPLLRTGPAGGAGVARNQGFRSSRGCFILFLDSDDLLMPNAIEGRLKVLEQNQGIDAVVGNSEYFRQIPGEYHNEWKALASFARRHEPLEAFLTGQSLWITSGPLWRREAVVKTGQWSTRKINDDNEYHLRALLAGVRFSPLCHVDWYWRLHGNDHISSPIHVHIPDYLLSLKEKISLLEVHRLLNDRNRRMLAWSCLLISLTCALERTVCDLRDAEAQWSEARSCSLVGGTLYFVGTALIWMQWFGPLRYAPRELARFLVYLDLQRKPPCSWSFLTAVQSYLKYLVIHFANWRHAKNDHARYTANSASCSPVVTRP